MYIIHVIICTLFPPIQDYTVENPGLVQRPLI